MSDVQVRVVTLTTSEVVGRGARPDPNRISRNQIGYYVMAARPVVGDLIEAGGAFYRVRECVLSTSQNIITAIVEPL